MPGTGQFPNSTCIITNQSSEGITYSAVIPEIIRRQRRNTRTIGQQKIMLSDSVLAWICEVTTEGITYMYIEVDLQTSQHITLYNSVFTYITVYLHNFLYYSAIHSMYTYIQSQLHTHFMYRSQITIIT